MIFGRRRHAAANGPSSPEPSPAPAPDLVLILPDGITDTDVLTAIVDTFTRVRAPLAGHAAQTDRAARRHRDPVRRADLAGQAAASRRAVAVLDETITGRLHHRARHDTGPEPATGPKLHVGPTPRVR